MSFQDIAKAVRAEADRRGLSATMSRLNDAIALACFGKKYAAVVSAEKAGKLDPIPSPPPFITAAARRYRMDEYAFGLSLHHGIDGKPVTRTDGTVGIAMDWLASTHEKELERLQSEGLTELVDPALVHRVLSMPGFQQMAFHGFTEWVIAEGEMHSGGVVQKVHDLLLHSKSRPAWNSGQRTYIGALAAAPLRLYVIDAVVAGYSLTLRPVSLDGEPLVRVSERAGSRPDLVGSVVGGRVIPHHGRLELAGGIFSFSTLAGLRIMEAVRNTVGTEAVSLAIRSAWFEQFDQPMPKMVLAGSDEAVQLITDTYLCSSVDTLASRIVADTRVEGSSDLGWTLGVKDDNGRMREACAIDTDEDVPGYVTVFYQSEERARKYRPWFEGLAGDVVSFLKREAQDPVEAAMDSAVSEQKKRVSEIPKDVLSSIVESGYRQHYAAFADRPIPLLDGETPRRMIKRPGGEARVRALLADFESNERRMAQEDGRASVSLEFLYKQLGLVLLPDVIVTKSPGMHPEQFAVNEAWVIFNCLDGPIQTKDRGDFNVIGLVDAGSTCFLNDKFLPVGSDFSELEARSFLEDLRVQKNTVPPQRLYIAGDVPSGALIDEAKRKCIPMLVVDPVDMDGIVGRLREEMDNRFSQFLADPS